MTSRILSLYVFFSLLSVTTLRAQITVPPNWKTEKIKGTRHIPYAPAGGRPYLNDRFSSGEIEMTDGFKLEDLKLRYSSYRDEIIYYNPEIPAQIVIDKSTLTGFSLIDEQGTKRIFRLQYYGGYSAGMHFFEVLADGGIKFLAFRKVKLEVCTPYNDLTGKLNNTIYQEAYNYYLYQPGKGYEPIRINKNSLLSKFSQPDQKQIKIILRKNGVKIKGEESFVKAWRLIEGRKIEPICKFEVSEKIPAK